MISTVPPTAAPADATNETTDGPVTTAAPPAGPAGPPEDPVTTAAPTTAGPPAPFSNASGLFANRTNATLGDVLDALTEEEVASIVRFVVNNEGESGVEMMKPFKMAEVSPRMFWSIARLNKDGDGDVITNGTRYVIRTRYVRKQTNKSAHFGSNPKPTKV